MLFYRGNGARMVYSFVYCYPEVCCFKDAEGRCPIHIGITTKNPIITNILLSHPLVDFSLKDRLGQTVFVIAMNCRDNEASASILAREPSAAEQVCIQ